MRDRKDLISKSISNTLLLYLLIHILALNVFACDLCAVYTSIQSTRGDKGNFNLGLSHQYIHYSSDIKPDNFPTAPGQHLQSNNTQIFANYLVTDKFLLQVNIPYLHKSYRRVEFGNIDKGTENGLGDVSLLGRYQVYSIFRDKYSAIFDVFGGIKTPTGSASRLREEGGESRASTNAILTLNSSSNSFFRHGGEGGSLIGGDDLALGSGSYDYILGSAVFTQYDKFFLRGTGQYTYRTEGKHNYTFGNDFQWNIGPGFFHILNDENSLSSRVRFSGEIKDSDRLFDDVLSNSDETQVYIGPEINYTSESDMFLGLVVEAPIKREKSSEQVVPNLRVISSISFKF